MRKRRLAPDTKGFFPRSRSEHIAFSLCEKISRSPRGEHIASLKETYRFFAQAKTLVAGEILHFVQNDSCWRVTPCARHRQVSSSSEAKDLGAVITSVVSEILRFAQNDGW